MTGRFHWKWYFAFHHVADRRVAPLLAEAAAAAAQGFHDRLRGAFYPFVFEERPITAADLDALSRGPG